MTSDNAIQVKSIAFAARIVRQFLANEKRDCVLSKQLLRSGTSVGANVEEAIGGQSRPGFSLEAFHRLQGGARSPVLAAPPKRNGLPDRTPIR